MIKKKDLPTGSDDCVRYWNAYRFYEVSGYEKRSGSGIG